VKAKQDSGKSVKIQCDVIKKFNIKIAFPAALAPISGSPGYF